MEENIEITLLYDIYGRLLTSKQQEVFENYYLYNLSLREIAENKNISYQAVRDSIKSSENMLRNFEVNVGMLSLLNKVKKAYTICQKEDINKYKEELLNLLK